MKVPKHPFSNRLGMETRITARSTISGSQSAHAPRSAVACFRQEQRLARGTRQLGLFGKALAVEILYLNAAMGVPCPLVHFRAQ